ncbi:MAG: FHA domain-containing protein [Anaerolineae bacterium]
MRQIKEIFDEYSQMRANGLDAKAALNVLRYHIEVLSKSDREELANMMRTLETVKASSPPPPRPAPQPESDSNSSRPSRLSSIKPIGSGGQSSNGTAPASAPSKTNSQPVLKSADSAPENIIWVTCPHCGKTNQRHEVFCYACGQLLEPVKGAYDTRVLGEQTTTLDNEYFGEDSVLVLRVRGSTETFETRPQKADHEIIIGRSTKGSVLAPDIDLRGKSAADLGVSRLHLSLRYDKEHHAVLASDLGSANGSFLNGQRMMPKEVRVMRHGDELRLGKMVMSVSFRHPSMG